MKGWISIHRKVMEHDFYKERRVFSKFEAWMDILLMVNHETTRVTIKGHVLECRRGESLLSISSWGKRWGWSKVKVQRFLNELKSRYAIVYESVTVSIRLTVCNYDSYQNSRYDSDTELIRSCSPNNNIINNNKRESAKNKFSPPSLDEVISYFKANGFGEEIAKKAFEYYSIAGWKDSTGKQVKSWKQKMISVWMKDDKPVIKIQNRAVDQSTNTNLFQQAIQ